MLDKIKIYVASLIILMVSSVIMPFISLPAKAAPDTYVIVTQAVTDYMKYLVYLQESQDKTLPIKPEDIKFQGLGSWIEGTNYRDPVKLKGLKPSEASDHDIRMIISSKVDNELAKQQWIEAQDFIRKRIKNRMQGRPAEDIAKALNSVNLYPPDQLVKDVVSDQDFMDKVGRKPNLGDEDIEGLWGKGRKPWTQNYELKKGKTIYFDGNKVKTGLSDMVLIEEGFEKYTAEGMAHLSEQMADKSLDAIDHKDAFKLGKQYERLEATFDKTKNLARINSDKYLTNAAGKLKQTTKELSELNKQRIEFLKNADIEAAEEISQKIADVTENFFKDTEYINELKSVLGKSKREAGFLRQIYAKNVDREVRLIYELLNAESDKWKKTSKALDETFDISKNSSLRKISGERILTGVFSAIDAYGVVIEANDGNTEGAMSNAIQAIATNVGMAPAVLTTLTQMIIDDAKENGYLFIAGYQDCEDLLVGICSAKGREKVLDKRTGTKNFDTLINENKMATDDEFRAVFGPKVTYQAQFCGSRDIEGKVVTQVDNKVSEKIYEKCMFDLNKKWREKRWAKLTEAAKKEGDFLAELENTKFDLTYKPEKAVLIKDNKDQKIARVTFSLKYDRNLDNAEKLYNEIFNTLKSMGSAKNYVEVRFDQTYKWFVNGKEYATDTAKSAKPLFKNSAVSKDIVFDSAGKHEIKLVYGLEIKVIPLIEHKVIRRDQSILGRAAIHFTNWWNGTEEKFIETDDVTEANNVFKFDHITLKEAQTTVDIVNKDDVKSTLKIIAPDSVIKGENINLKAELDSESKKLGQVSYEWFLDNNPKAFDWKESIYHVAGEKEKEYFTLVAKAKIGDIIEEIAKANKTIEITAISIKGEIEKAYKDKNWKKLNELLAQNLNQADRQLALNYLQLLAKDFYNQNITLLNYLRSLQNADNASYNEFSSKMDTLIISKKQKDDCILKIKTTHDTEQANLSADISTLETALSAYSAYKPETDKGKYFENLQAALNNLNHKVPEVIPVKPEPAIKYEAVCGLAEIDFSGVSVSLKADKTSLKVRQSTNVKAVVSNLPAGISELNYVWSGNYSGKGADVTFLATEAGKSNLSVLVKYGLQAVGSDSVTFEVAEGLKAKLTGLEGKVFYGTTKKITAQIEGEEIQPPPPPPVATDDCDPTGRNPFNSCGPIKVTHTASVSVPPSGVIPVVPINTTPNKIIQTPTIQPPVKSNKIFVWQSSEPGIGFKPEKGNEPSAQVTFSRMGKIKIWAEIHQINKDGVEETVGETDQQEVEVIAPEFTITFTPPEGEGKVGSEITAVINSKPDIKKSLVDYRWVEPSNRAEYGPGQIKFTPKDNKPVQLHCIARVPHYGDSIDDEIKATYTANSATVKVKIERPAYKTPVHVWKEGVGLVEVKDQYVVFQDVEASAQVEGVPLDNLRYKWTVNQGSHISGGEFSRQVRVNRSETGTCNLTVDVSDNNGVKLGSASNSFEVTVSQADIKKADGKKQENSQKAKDVLTQAKNYVKQQALDDAIKAMDDAIKQNIKSPELESYNNSIKKERENIFSKIKSCKEAIAKNDFEEAAKVTRDIRGKYPNYKPVIQIAQLINAEQDKYMKKVGAAINQVNDAFGQKDFEKVPVLTEQVRSNYRLEEGSLKLMKDYEQKAAYYLDKREKKRINLTTGEQQLNAKNYYDAFYNFNEGLGLDLWNPKNPEYIKYDALRQRAKQGIARIESLYNTVNYAINYQGYEIKVVEDGVKAADEILMTKTDDKKMISNREMLANKLAALKAYHNKFSSAKKLYQEGQAFEIKNQLNAALKKYKESMSINPQQTTQVAIARVENKLSKKNSPVKTATKPASTPPKSNVVPIKPIPNKQPVISAVKPVVPTQSTAGKVGNFFNSVINGIDTIAGTVTAVSDAISGTVQPQNTQAPVSSNYSPPAQNQPVPQTMSVKPVITKPVLVSDNWNTGGCDYTDTSTFNISGNKFITSLETWYNWQPGENTLNYTLYKDGNPVSSGSFHKGSCDTYQTSWCVGNTALNKNLSSGTYKVKYAKSKVCNNIGHNNGFIKVYEGQPPVASVSTPKAQPTSVKNNLDNSGTIKVTHFVSTSNPGQHSVIAPINSPASSVYRHVTIIAYNKSGDNVHIFKSGENFGPENKIPTGQYREIKASIYPGAALYIYAGRNGKVLNDLQINYNSVKEGSSIDVNYSSYTGLTRSR